MVYAETLLTLSTDTEVLIKSAQHLVVLNRYLGIVRIVRTYFPNELPAPR